MQIKMSRRLQKRNRGSGSFSFASPLKFPPLELPAHFEKAPEEEQSVSCSRGAQEEEQPVSSEQSQR